MYTPFHPEARLLQIQDFSFGTFAIHILKNQVKLL